MVQSHKNISCIFKIKNGRMHSAIKILFGRKKVILNLIKFILLYINTYKGE
jgi:hypothetical protein